MYNKIVVAESLFHSLVGEETSFYGKSGVDEEKDIDLVKFVEPDDVLQILIVQSIYVKISNTDVSCQWLANGHDRVVLRVVPSVYDVAVSAPVCSRNVGVHVGWDFMMLGLVLRPDSRFRLRD
jgi:hypothetical protein